MFLSLQILSNIFPGEFPLVTKLDGFKGTAKYPQMSQKILVQDSKKKGRHLVAKEKINPGSIEIMFQFRWIRLIRIADMSGIQAKYLCPILEWSGFHILSKNLNLSVCEPSSYWDGTNTNISNVLIWGPVILSKVLYKGGFFWRGRFLVGLVLEAVCWLLAKKNGGSTAPKITLLKTLGADLIWKI